MSAANGWTSAKLEEVAKTATGGTPARKNPKYFEGTIPWVKSGELDDNLIYDTEEHLSDGAIRDSSAKVFPRRTVLVALYGATVGKTAILEIEAATNQAICAIFVNSRVVDHRYLRYFLMHVRPDLLGQRYGGAQPNISQTIIRNTQIAMPPLDEQRQIAALLSAVQRAIERQERLIALTAELKKAHMHKLFTEGTRRERLKQTEIGPVPQSWKIVPLADVVEYIDYGISQPIPKTPPPDSVKIVSTADITKEGEILYWKIRRLTAPPRTVQRLTLRAGDVLFNWRNSSELIGKTAVFEQQPEPHVFASFVLRIRCDEVRTHNTYLSYLMNYYREQGVFIKLSRRAVNQANYNRNEISVLPIPHPPIDEQLEIANAITTVVNARNVHEQQRDMFQGLFRTLLHQLMTAQIRVHDLDLSKLGVDSEEAELQEVA